MIEIIVSLVAAYIVADALSGIYHIITDYGWNIPHQVKLFKYHHENPETMTFDWQPFLAGIPICFLAFWAYPVFFITLGLCLCLSQVAHLYTHRKAPYIIKILQQTGLFISKKHHYAHHGGQFNKNFCIFSGWNDFWLNPIAKYLEKYKR